MSITEIKYDLKKFANTEHAVQLQRFFKTGPGDYGEGDIFIGLKVPMIRTIAKKHSSLALTEIKDLLHSVIHEERLVALFILVERFKKADNDLKEQIFNFYIKNKEKINNWDLVDLSADKIVGGYLFNKDISLLIELSKSDDLWDKRIAIISTFYFIKHEEFIPTLQIAEILLKDKHDLIHKGVGWMLREIGKRNIDLLEDFLQQHYKIMPRTMLRYAIEKFPEYKRQSYLKGRI